MKKLILAVLLSGVAKAQEIDTLFMKNGDTIACTYDFTDGKYAYLKSVRDVNHVIRNKGTMSSNGDWSIPFGPIDRIKTRKRL